MDALSPNLSIEATAAKVEPHFHRGDKSEDRTSIMRKIREAIDPSGAAMVYLETAKLVTDGLTEIAEKLIAAGTPKEYAIPQAYGIYREHRKLLNASNAIMCAEERLSDEKDYSVPSESFLRDFMSAAEDVNDEDIQCMFGAILAGEMEAPGSFSKRSMSILSNMSKREAEIFKELCSYSTYVISSNNSPSANVVPLEISSEKYQYHPSAITVSDVISLSALGLVNMAPDVCSVVKCKSGEAVAFRASDSAVIGINKSESQIEIKFDHIVTTSIGEELSRICPIASGTKMAELVSNKLKRFGLEVETIPLKDLRSSTGENKDIPL